MSLGGLPLGRALRPPPHDARRGVGFEVGLENMVEQSGEVVADALKPAVSPHLLDL
jgi:hypothetical protein